MRTVEMLGRSESGRVATMVVDTDDDLALQPLATKIDFDHGRL